MIMAEHEKVQAAGVGGFLIFVLIVIVLAIIGLVYLIRRFLSGRSDRPLR